MDWVVRWSKPFSRGGDKVVATARKPEELADLIAAYGGDVRTVKVDVTSPADVGKAIGTAVEAFGRIDVVVNSVEFLLAEAGP